MDEFSTQVQVSELYSPPRISKEAAKMGLKTGQSYDLATGWDLDKPGDRRKMWQSLKEEKPEVLIVCPPCTAFTVFQELNYSRWDPEKSACVLLAGLRHLQLAAAVMRWQIRQGRKIVFEQPKNARSWEEAEIQSLAGLLGMKKVTCDQCMFGLSVGDSNRLNKKPTTFLTNLESLWRLLDVKCNGSHPHEHLKEGLPKKAQVYPKALCKTIARGIRQEVGRNR